MSDDIQSTFTLDIEDLVAKLNEAAGNIEKTTHEMEESFGGVGESLKGIQEMMHTAFEVTGVAIAYEAIEKLADVFKEGAEQATQMEHAAMRLGITVSEYQGLELAADKAGVGMDRLTRAGVMLDAKLTQAREGNERMRVEFEAAGVSAAQLADHNYRGADALVTFGQNAQNTAVQMQLIGVRNSEVMAVLPQLAGGFDDLAHAAAAHGAITEEQAGKLHELHAAFAVAEFETKNYKLALLADLAPAMETAIGWFQELTLWIRDLVHYFQEQMAPVVAAVGDAFETLAHIWEQNSGLASTLKDAWAALLGGLTPGEFIIRALVEAFAFFSKAMLEAQEIIYEMARVAGYEFDEIKMSVLNLAEVANKALHLDFAGAKASWEAGTAALVALNKKSEEDILNSRMEMAKKLQAIDLAVDLPEIDAGKGKGEKEERKTPKGELPDLGKKSNDDPELDLLRFQMEQEEKGSEERIALAHMVADRMIEIGKGTVKEAVAAQKVLVSAYKEQAAEQRKLAEEDAKVDRDTMNETLKYSQKVLDEEYKNREITGADYVQLSRVVAEQKLSVEEAYISKMEQLNTDNATKLKSLEMDRVKAHQAADEAIAESSKKVSLDIEKSWESVAKPITKSFGDMFSNIIVHQKGFHASVVQLEQSLVTTMANGAIKIAEDWATTELAKTAASQAGMEARQVLNALAKALGLATEKTTSTVSITTSAAEGAAAAMASTAAIPIVGPELAAASGATTYAEIMAYNLAEGGWDVPYSTDLPLTQLHQGEMVLPERHASVIRDLADNGGGGGGGATHNHNYAVNIQALDSRSVERMFSTNGRHLVKALHEQVKNFNTPVHGKK